MLASSEDNRSVAGRTGWIGDTGIRVTHARHVVELRGVRASEVDGRHATYPFRVYGIRGSARATPFRRCLRAVALADSPHVRHPDLRTRRILVARDWVRRHRHSVVRQLAPLARQAHRRAGSRAGVGRCSGQGAAGRGAGGASRRADSRALPPGIAAPSTRAAPVAIPHPPVRSPSILTAPAACSPT